MSIECNVHHDCLTDEYIENQIVRAYSIVSCSIIGNRDRILSSLVSDYKVNKQIGSCWINSPFER